MRLDLALDGALSEYAAAAARVEPTCRVVDDTLVLGEDVGGFLDAYAEAGPRRNIRVTAAKTHATVPHPLLAAAPAPRLRFLGLDVDAATGRGEHPDVMLLHAAARRRHRRVVPEVRERDDRRRPESDLVVERGLPRR